MSIKETYDNAKEMTLIMAEATAEVAHDVSSIGKLALIKCLDWIDNKLCSMNDLGDE